MGALSPVHDTLPVVMQEELRKFVEGNIKWVTSCLEAGRKKGLFTFKGAAAEKAHTIVAGYISSLLLYKVLGNHLVDPLKGLS